MSLVTDNFLFALWAAAQVPNAHEDKSANFWDQLYHHYIFKEKHWLVARESSPTKQDNRRRVDMTVRYINATNSQFEVLFFHEYKKGGASTTDITEVEAQAYDACIGRLINDDNLAVVYAVTSVGTRARHWQLYNRNSDYLEPLFGSEDLGSLDQYIEENSTDAHILRASYDRMKNLPPTPVHTTVTELSSLYSTPMTAVGIGMSNTGGKGKAVDQSSQHTPKSKTAVGIGMSNAISKGEAVDQSNKTQPTLKAITGVGMSNTGGQGQSKQDPPKSQQSQLERVNSREGTAENGQRYRVFSRGGIAISTWSKEWEEGRMAGRRALFHREHRVYTFEDE